MYQKKSRTVGFSQVISIPAEICKNLNIKAGTVLNIEQKDHEIIMRLEK